MSNGVLQFMQYKFKLVTRPGIIISVYFCSHIIPALWLVNQWSHDHQYKWYWSVTLIHQLLKSDIDWLWHHHWSISPFIEQYETKIKTIMIWFSDQYDVFGLLKKLWYWSQPGDLDIINIIFSQQPTKHHIDQKTKP